MGKWLRGTMAMAAVCAVTACGGADKPKGGGARSVTTPRPDAETNVPTPTVPADAGGLSLTFAAATFFGGVDVDVIDDLALDATGAVVVALNTRMTDGSYTGQVVKLNADLTAALWTKRFPGRVRLALAPDGALVAGVTTGADLPTTAGALQPARNPGGASGVDVYLTKLAAADGAVLWATYLGGKDKDTVSVITVAPDGAIFLAGEALFFPVTAGAFQEAFAGWAVPAYVAAVSGDGTKLLAATYVSGDQRGYETPTAIAVNGQAVIMAGYTSGNDFPTTANAYQPAPARAGANFLAVLNRELSTLSYATYLGTAAQPLRQTVAFGAGHAAFVAGSGVGTGCSDGNLSAGFVMRLDWATGEVTPAVCLEARVHVYAHGLAVDAAGNLIVSGDFAADATQPVASTGLPLTGDAFDAAFAANEAFLGAFTSTGAPLYFTYLGGTRADFSTGLAMGTDGTVYVRGRTASFDFPVTPGAYKTYFAGKEFSYAEEGYVAKFIRGE